MKQLLYTILIFMLFTNNQCKKDTTPAADNPYGLPNATQTGANMFACRINGVNQVAKNSIYTIGAWMSPNDDTLNVGGQFSGTYFQSITLGSINKNRTVNQAYSLEDAGQTSFYYATDSICNAVPSSVVKVFKAKGIITYSKIDATNKIVSGTFNCTFLVPGCDSIRVTDGRFDIKYHY
jgi:hypothetical protein